MDVSSLTASALQMSLGNTQQAMNTAMIKMNAKQQDAMAEMLAQNAKQSSMAMPPDSRYQLSLYA
jgi:hypothetical protein